MSKLYHSKLGRYYQSKPLHFIKGIKQVPNIRKLVEQPWQLTKGELWVELTKTLIDFDFHQTKVGYSDHDSDRSRFSIFDTLSDFSTALHDTRGFPIDHPSRKQIEAIHRSLDQNSFILSIDPSILIQQLYNELVWDWNENTQLGRCIRDFVVSYKQIWFKRKMSPPALDVTFQRILTGHTKEVLSVCITPNGKLVASGSVDKTVKVWEARTGALKHTLDKHTGAVTSVALTPDGNTLVSGSQDKTVRIWDLDKRLSIHTLFGHTEPVRSVAISNDGLTVVSGSEDNTIRMWNSISGKLIREFQGHTETVKAVSISSDGKVIASGSKDKTVRIWDSKTLVCSGIINERIGEIQSIAMTPDGKTIAISGHGLEYPPPYGPSQRALKIFNVETLMVRKSIGELYDEQFSICLTPDGKTLAGGGNHKKIQLWDVETGELKCSLKGHLKIIRSIAMSADGRIIVSSSHEENNNIRIWNTEKYKSDSALEQSFFRDITFDHELSPDGRLIALGDYKRNVNIRNVKTGALEITLEGHSGNYPSFAFSADGNTIITCNDNTNDKTVRFWDVKTGTAKLIFQWPENSDETMGIDPAAPVSVCLSANEKTLVVGSLDGAVRLWDITSGKLLKALYGHQSTVCRVAISSDEKAIVSGHLDGKITIWPQDSEGEAIILKKHTNMITSLSISTDNKMLVSSSIDNSIRLWDLLSGKILATLPCYAAVKSVRFNLGNSQLHIADDFPKQELPNTYDRFTNLEIPNIYFVDIVNLPV